MKNPMVGIRKRYQKFSLAKDRLSKTALLCNQEDTPPVYEVLDLPPEHLAALVAVLRGNSGGKKVEAYTDGNDLMVVFRDSAFVMPFQSAFLRERCKGTRVLIDQEALASFAATYEIGVSLNTPVLFTVGTPDGDMLYFDATVAGETVRTEQVFFPAPFFAYDQVYSALIRDTAIIAEVSRAEFRKTLSALYERIAPEDRRKDNVLLNLEFRGETFCVNSIRATKDSADLWVLRENREKDEEIALRNRATTEVTEHTWKIVDLENMYSALSIFNTRSVTLKTGYATSAAISISNGDVHFVVLPLVRH